MKIEFNLPKVDLSWIKISHIVLFAAVLRFFVMSFPQDGGMIFDEVHYIKAARALMQGIPANAEHPPLTKIISMVSMKIFGDHWFGWRFPMVVSSLVSTYLVYKIAREFMEERLALIVASFMVFDIVFFIQGNIYVLENPALMFGLAFVYYYLRGMYDKAGVMMGTAFLCNEKALFLLLGVAIYHVMNNFTLKPSKVQVKQVSAFLAVCIVIGAGGLWVTDAIWTPARLTQIQNIVHETVVQDQYGTPLRTETSTRTETTYADYIRDPITHVLFMVNYYSGINEGLTTSAENFRPPWSWIAPIGNWNNPPVYFATSVCGPDGCFYPINYRSQTPIFIWFMTLPIVGLALWNHREKTSRFILSWIAGTYMPWFIWEFFKMNMPFNHYFLFTIPIVCFGIPWFWSKIGGKYKIPLLMVHLVLAAAYFWWYFPVGIVRLI